MGFKEKLKNNEMAHYFGVTWKMRKNEMFRNNLLTLYDKPDVLVFKHLGLDNPDKNIYLIYLNNKNRGFFSLFNLVLDGLEFAEYYHLTPVVEFGEDIIYHENNGINGIINSFEYYFKQPGNISVTAARQSKNVVFYEFVHRKLAIPDFNLTIGASLTDETKLEDYINRRGDLITRYIQFSDRTQAYLDDTVKPLIGERKTLGVHVRGTDMNIGYNGHAKIVPAEEYLRVSAQAVKDKGFEKVFLATDEEGVINLFESEFGNRLVYYKDILRSEDGQALHFSQNSRENHQYLLGLEVLRDMYSLALSDGLVAGISNVSLAARMMKRSFNKEYIHINILNNGINHSNILMTKSRK